MGDENIVNYSPEILMKQKKEYGEWAGYLEISTAGILFNANIRLYIISNNSYRLYNEFTQDYNESKIVDNINLLFINNNHFNLLIKNEYVDIFHISDNIKKLKFKKIITKANEDKSNLINTLKLNKIKNPGYVKYNRKTCLIYNKEIEEYKKDSNKIPNWLKNNKKAKNKTQRKRWCKSRKLVENNLFLVLLYW